MNKTPTLFVTGLVVGALAVFLIRAATGGASSESDAPAPPPHDAPDHGAMDHGAVEPGAVDPGATDVEGLDSAPSSGKRGVIELRLSKAGKVALARMRMPDGGAHPLKAGGHAAMGDYTVYILGRKGKLDGHLHAHPDGRLELTVKDASGQRLAHRIFTPDENRTPENQICPVMGNEVDPDVYVDYEGRRVGFCCPGCDELFLEEPERYLKKVDKELEARGGGK